MLKKLRSSPAQPLRAETRFSPVGVLASLRGSEVLEGIFRSPRSILWANSHTKCGWYLLAFSLAAVLLNCLFEYPEDILTSKHYAIF